jgi:DNA polymerase elongation subunit (family B)
MYPSLILTLNASPETIIGDRNALRESEYTEDDCVWGYFDTREVKHLQPNEPWQQYTNGQYKMVYDPEAPDTKWSCDEGDGPRYEKCYFLKHDIQKGFLTECVEELIELKNQYRGTSLYGSTKTVTNSIYGVLGFATEDSSFRLFDWRIAEAITLSGRKMVQNSAEYIVQHAHDSGYNDAEVVMGDTDGFGVSYPSASSRHEALTTTAEAVANLNEWKYDDMMDELFNCPSEHHAAGIDVETYSPRVFVPAENPPHGETGVSKRYIKWTTWEN